MFDDVGQGQANQSIAGVSAGSIQFVGIIEGVAALGGGALFENLFKALTVARDGRIESGVGLGFDVDQRGEGTFGSTVLFHGAILEVHDVNGFAVAMGIAFCRAAIDMSVAAFLVLMVAHAHSLGTEGNAVGVKFYALFIEQMGIGVFAVFAERDHGTDIFFQEIAVMRVGVMVAIAAKDGNVKIEPVFPGGLEKTVEGFQREGEIAFVAARQEGQQGQVVAVLVEHQVIIAIAKEVGVAVVIVAPFGGGRGIASLMVALVNALGEAVAGGFAAG